MVSVFIRRVRVSVIYIVYTKVNIFINTLDEYTGARAFKFISEWSIEFWNHWWEFYNRWICWTSREMRACWQNPNTNALFATKLYIKRPPIHDASIHLY